MPITMRSTFEYKSENYNFTTDYDELRTIMVVSAILKEVISHTESQYISFNAFCRDAVRAIPGIYFSYDALRYYLVLLANEKLYDGKKLIQTGAIMIEQEAFSNTKKIMFNGEYGKQRLQERVDFIMNLSQAELAEYERYGAHRDKGNRLAFRKFSLWKSENDSKELWMKFMHKILPNVR